MTSRERGEAHMEPYIEYALQLGDRSNNQRSVEVSPSVARQLGGPSPSQDTGGIENSQISKATATYPYEATRHRGKHR